jgi:DNA-binding MarR family transcriptional regulator
MSDNTEKEDRLTLQLLEVVGRQSDLSQRHMAKQMGVALGLANSYLKRCVRKGLVKVREAPANRYLYYLTPKGFSEKARLTAQYLSLSLSFYRKAGESCLRTFEACKRNGWNRVLLCGISDLAEIATVRALEAGIEIVGTYDADAHRTRFMSRPVWRAFEEAPPFDAGMVTDLNGAAASYERLVNRLERARILVPDILGLDDLGRQPE